MKKKIQTVRLHAAMITLALLVPMLIAAPAALATDAAEAPLAVFRPGAPGEPSWTVLHLEPDGPDRVLQIRFDDSEFRCPFAWGLVLFTDGPSGLLQHRSLTIDFAYGHNGARIHTSGPVAVERDDVEHDGASACETGGGGITVILPQLPAGDLYLLQYKAGTPFEGLAELTAPQGGIRVVGESHGDRVFYLGAGDFGVASMHVEAYGPQGCGGPNSNAEDGFCKPQYRWPGGLLPGAEIATERSARVTFAEQPYFFVGAPTNLVGVTNATLRDPLGLIHTIYASTGLAAGETAVSVGGIRYSTSGPVADHPSGAYTIEINMNADIGQTAVPWHAAGADFHFPR